MIKKYKYVFDKATGHFIKKLYEEESSNTQNNNQQNNQLATDTSTNLTSYKSVDADPVIQDLNGKKIAAEQKFQTDLNTLNKQLELAKQNAAKSSVIKAYDPVNTDPTVLNILKKINDLKKLHAINLANIEDQRLSLLQKLSLANELYYKIPEKYKGLNESNLHTAKIYMKDLVLNDEEHILKGMADFKRAFKDTNLLYGKDSSGYFVIAVDKEDLNTAYDTLEEVGYLRDDIIDTLLPLVLDRTKMVI